MPTVIDSLVLEIGLDPSKFTQSQREALSALRKFEEEAESQGKRVETQTKRLNEVLLNFKREAVSTLALFVGGRGTAEFISFLTNADAATGRLTKTVGMNAQEIAMWQGAIRQVGGSAESANAGIAGLNAEVVRFSITGKSEMLGTLTRLGVALYDQNGKLKTAGQLYRDLSDAIGKKEVSEREAAGFLSMIPGMNQDFINLIMEGKLASRLEAARRAGVPSAEDTERASKFQGALALLTIAAENAGRALLNVMYPGLTAVANGLRALIELSPGTAGVIGAIGTILGFRAAFRGARSLLFRGGAAAATGAGAGAAAGGTGAAAAGAGGAAAGAGIGSFALRTLGGAAGFYFGSTTEAGAPTLTDRWDKPYMGPEGGKKAGGLGSAAEIEAYIRAAAIKRGMDPEVALKVWGSEGRSGYVGDRGSSFGPFQLHYGGMASGKMGAPGLGDEFTRRTGLHASDPSTWQQQVDFSLDEARKGGWGPWHGWKGDRFAGIGGGGAPAAALGRDSAARASGGSTSTTSIQVSTMNITLPQVTDAAGFTKELPQVMKRSVTAAGAEGGPN